MVSICRKNISGISVTDTTTNTNLKTLLLLMLTSTHIPIRIFNNLYFTHRKPELGACNNFATSDNVRKRIQAPVMR